MSDTRNNYQIARERLIRALNRHLTDADWLLEDLELFLDAYMEMREELKNERQPQESDAP